MDEATWAALAATLTVLGLVWTWVSYQRRGVAAGMRALGFTLLPVAAWLTGTLETLTEIAGSVTDWATSLVFNPVTWTGIGMGGFGIALIIVSGIIRDRQLARGQGATDSTGRVLTEGPTRGRAPATRPAATPVDDDLADIEALLKRRGIQ